MNTDRELLELAAKAAAIEYDPRRSKPHPVSGAFWGLWLVIHGEPNEHTRRYWNPLADAGDRYRLARHLGLTIDFTECTVWKRLSDHSLVQEYWGGDCGDEAHAIVRAAAEIGKEMP